MLSHDTTSTIAIVTILSGIATLLVIIRLIQRQKRRKLGIDDYLLPPCLLIMYMQDGFAIAIGAAGGEGKPITEATPEELRWLFLLFYAAEVGYTCLIALIKSSILISLFRIFGHVRAVKYMIYFVASLVAGWWISILLTVILQCSPVQKGWQPLLPGHCIDIVPFLWANSSINFAIDLMILCIPIWPVLRLEMKWPRKLLSLISFLTGIIACIASILRATSTATLNEADITESIFYASIWTYIETNLGIISACLPFLTNTIGHKVVEWLRPASAWSSRALKALMNPSTLFNHNSSQSDLNGNSVPVKTSSDKHNLTGDLDERENVKTRSAPIVRNQEVV